MTKSNFQFIYHDIGQGLFHTGKLEKFNFVFDCGKLGKQEILNEKIKEYKSSVLTQNIIDMLIISHFDYDHISGLDELFEDNIKINTVVIPYLSIEDRFILSLKNVKILEDYYVFLANPIKYFQDKNVENIIIIYPEKKDETELTLLMKDKTLEVYSDKETYLVLKKWIFKFYNQDLWCGKNKRLIDIKKIKTNLLNEMKKDGILNNSNLDAQLVNVITEKNKREIIKQKYKNLINDLNYTSLSMYCGPKDYKINGFEVINNCKAEYKQQSNNHLFANIKFNGLNNNGEFGELVLGDMVLNKKELVKEMIIHYNEFYKNISLVALPHHGSKNNWCKDIINSLHYCNIWLASAGFSNRFSHPSYDVIMDIEDRDKKFFVCNEFVRAVVEGEIEWDESKMLAECLVDKFEEILL